MSHGQSELERGFSATSLILTEGRASMSEQTLNACINTVDAIKSVNKDVTKIPIDNKLISMAHNARKQYQLYLDSEKEKRLKEAETKQKESEKLEMERSARNKRKLEVDELTEKVEKARKKINEKNWSIKEMSVAADQMLKKVSTLKTWKLFEWLKKCLKK